MQHRALRKASVDDLTITDAADWRRAGVELLGELVAALRRDRVTFLIPRRRLGWDRTAFLNLTWWTPGGGELLDGEEIAADQIAHVALHHVVARRVGRRALEAVLLGEAIASGFDAYVIGMLLRGAPRAAYLREQVPRWAERAQDAGVSERAFEALLARTAADPARAFEELRALLYDTARALLPARTVEGAAAALTRDARGPFAAVLHHYELSNWLLHCRAHGRAVASVRARRLDAALRRAPDPIQVVRGLLR